MIANVALDYTEWAPPLPAAAIKRDIDAYETQHCRTPSKIVLWVHQWEYLVKRCAEAVKPQYIVTDAHIDTVGILAHMRPAESSDGGKLYGIQVEVRDPLEHGE